jgi:serine/threonine protein kinase
MSATALEHDDPFFGRQIDGCEVLGRLGAGALSALYLVEDPLGRRCALRVFHPECGADPELRERFFCWARGCARIEHSSVVRVFSLGSEEPWHFVRMEYLEGETALARVQRAGALAWEAATTLALDLSDGLEQVHAQRLVHGDVGPHHALLCDGAVKLIGFRGAQATGSAWSTSFGHAKAQAAWTSPERIGAKLADPRSDLYSLGATLYYLAAAARPFPGENDDEIFLKHFYSPPEPVKVHCPELPQAVCDVIDRCLKKKQAERYQSGAELSRDLRALLGLDP